MDNVFTAIGDWQPLLDLPDGMAAGHKPLQGKRVKVRATRAYGATSVIEARWPDDNLSAARTPKLCFVLTGTVALQVNDYVLHCQPGHGILIPPGTHFASGGQSYLDCSKQHQGICEILQIMPYHGGLICWLSRRRYEGASAPRVQEITCSIPRSRVPFYLNQLVDETLKGQPRQQLICDSMLRIAFVFLLRELEGLPVLETGEIHDNNSDTPIEYRTYSIKHAREYIENNLREPLSIDKVARYVCMSRKVFTQGFRVKTGKTFSQYVQDMRFEEARKLLKRSGLAVRHIAAAVGLRPNRLRILFHQHEGISPM